MLALVLVACACLQAPADDVALSPGGDGNRIVFDPANPARFPLTHNSGTHEGIDR